MHNSIETRGTTCARVQKQQRISKGVPRKEMKAEGRTVVKRDDSSPDGILS